MDQVGPVKNPDQSITHLEWKGFSETSKKLRHSRAGRELRLELWVYWCQVSLQVSFSDFFFFWNVFTFWTGIYVANAIKKSMKTKKNKPVGELVDNWNYVRNPCAFCLRAQHLR